MYCIWTGQQLSTMWMIVSVKKIYSNIIIVWRIKATVLEPYAPPPPQCMDSVMTGSLHGSVSFMTEKRGSGPGLQGQRLLIPQHQSAETGEISPANIGTTLWKWQNSHSTLLNEWRQLEILLFLESVSYLHQELRWMVMSSTFTFS